MPKSIGIRKSQRVHIPKNIIKNRVRKGWARACKEMHTAQQDKLLLEGLVNRFDEEEWEW